PRRFPLALHDALPICLVFGIFTLGAAWAGSLDQMLVLRALAGVGIGGLLPNLIALNGELAPRRFRATMIILMFCGITLGGAVPADRKSTRLNSSHQII